MNLIILAACVLGLLYQFGVFDSSTSSTPDYTIGQAVTDMPAYEPIAPFTNQAYDTRVATFLFDHQSPDHVKSIVQNDLAVPPPILTAAEDKCVTAG